MRGNYLAFIRLASNRLWLRVDESAPEFSISVPNSTSCFVGTRKNAAENSALRCRRANSDSRHIAGNDLDHLGAVIIRYAGFLNQHVTCTARWRSTRFVWSAALWGVLPEPSTCSRQNAWQPEMLGYL
jgi:hypothetical protein